MASRPSRAPRTLRYVVAAIAVLLIGLWLGGHPSWLPSPLRSAFVDDNKNQLVNEALDLLSRDYYRPINRQQLVDKGLAAAIASLNDPYSHYFSKADYQAFLNQSNPHLSGIGIDVLPDPRGLRIGDVFSGSPAARAGLKRDDVIVRVGTVPLANRSTDFASRLIKGRAGTTVTLTVLSGKERRVVSITRARLVIPVASSNIVDYHGMKIGDVRLTSFTDGSGGEVRLQVQKMLHAGARALILDLRDNGGGLLDEAVNVASVFIPDGTIVSTRGRSQPTQVYAAKGDAIAPKIPMVVLADRGTASAAEIVTGALKDRGRAKVVGTHTYGKGVFQEIQTLSNGGALDMTVGEYFTPNGRNLGGGGVREGAGIPPDVQVASDPKALTDRQLTVAEQTVASEVQ
ncbi:MAG TPA: S41 family peptidase [Solirubrobacteraceae bacterium]|nr:S41 family peptidase [Solirubrobacteraceae bacterium]